MKLIFVRHGQDDGKYRGGWSSLDLTAEGKRQVKQLSGYISNNITKYNITKILASDLPRTMTTAKVISEVVGIKVEPDKQLREMNNGDLAGMLKERAETEYPGLYWSALNWEQSYPNGESPRMFYERVKNAWVSFKKLAEGLSGNVLLVTHGGVIDVIQCCENGKVYTNKHQTYAIGHAEIICV